MVRTNVVLDEKKIKAAKKAFDISTTKEAEDNSKEDVEAHSRLASHRRRRLEDDDEAHE